MEFLKKLFGTTADGQAEALTYEQLAQKMTEAKLNVADLSTGEYVAKAKYDAKVEELKGISAQLGDANKAIEGFKAMDLEGIQKSADEWKQKYEQDGAERTFFRCGAVLLRLQVHKRRRGRRRPRGVR